MSKREKEIRRLYEGKRYYLVSRIVLVGFPPLTDEQWSRLKRTKPSKRGWKHDHYQTPFSDKFKVADKTYVYFPRLTPEQDSLRQKYIANQNPHNYKTKLSLMSSAQLSVIAKRKWQNPEYRAKMLAAVTSPKRIQAFINIDKSYMKTEKFKQQCVKNFERHTKAMKEISRLRKKLGLDTAQMNNLKIDELEEYRDTLASLASALPEDDE